MHSLSSPSPRRSLEALTFAVAAAWTIPAHALDLDECKSLEDDPKRLACYDSLTGRTVTKPDRQMPSVVADVKNDVSGIGLVARLKPDATLPGTRPSSLAERWDVDGQPSPAVFSLRPYKPNYVLPAFYSTRPTTRAASPNPDNDTTMAGPLDHIEGKFQISLKSKLLADVGFTGSNFWFGYTQSSRWQVYNKQRSREFRENDYEPELMYTAPTHYSLFGLDGNLVGLSLNHQSNGRDVPESRGWNRVIGQVGLENDDWSFLVRPWLRIREKASNDDNSDILDYMGRGELIGIRKLGNQQIAVTLRHSLKTGDRAHGSVAVDWAFPVYGYLRGHVQLFSGYGESLLEYNHRQNSIGVGISIGEWL